MRLSVRIALAVGAAVALLVLVSGWLLVRLVTGDLQAQQDAHLRERAADLAGEARGWLRAGADDRPYLEHARERRLFAPALDVGVRVTGPRGTVSGGPQPGEGADLPDAGDGPVTFRADGEGWRVLSVPLRSARGGEEGTLWLFSPASAVEEQRNAVRRRVVGTALVAAPVGGLLAGGVASGVARPLRVLRRRASGLDPRVSATRLRYEPTGVGEVDDLAATLRTVLARYDEQAARTAEALATARSFSAAASHELRTPLMSMRTDLDVLADHPDLPADGRAEVVADLQAEHARLLGLLVMLRALADGDLVQPEAFGPVDVAELADTAVEAARTAHPGTVFRLTAEPATVHAWEPGLRSAVANLLTNAAVHGRGAGGGPARVEVGVRPERDGVLLTVDDAGPGIPPQDREAVLRRFVHRPDSPGSGLGLTLVAQQVALHRGSLTLTEPPAGRGTRVAVRLPAHSPGTPAARHDWLAQDSHKDGPYAPR